MTSEIKVFLLEPEQDYPKQLIFADSEKDAKSNSTLPASTKFKLLNNDPYLHAKCREVSVTVLDIDYQSPFTLRCLYNNKEYYLSKNLAQLL